MSDRKYQIFVSSTYTDLQEERTKLLFAILKLNYIPAGMEFFTAIDEEQMQYIRRVIDESDYYVLLMGARYGSMDNEGVSYTEREFDYAVSRGKTIIALIHRNPDRIERGRTDMNEALFQKFMDFRNKVISSGRLISYWEDTTELITNFQASLIQNIQRFPAIGWMRGDIPANAETLQKIATLELENQRLRESVKNAGGMQLATDIKMEAYSVTNPRDVSDVEIECVSLWIECQFKGFEHMLFGRHLDSHTQNELFEYYSNKAIPWFIRMAKICRIDLKITNPYPFPVNNMSSEQHLLNGDGTDVKILSPDDILEPPPIHPQLGRVGYLSEQKKPSFSLTPNQSTVYTHHRYYVPTSNQDLIYQRIFFANNIIEPVKKEINVHYRIKKVTYKSDDLIRIIQNFENRQKLNDAKVFDFVEGVLEKERKEQDSCNTAK